MTLLNNPSRPATGPKPQRWGTIVVWAGAVIAGLAVLTLVVLAPEGIRQSADAGAPTVPLWVALVPAIVAMGVIRLLPWFAPNTAPIVVDRPAVSRTVVGLLVCAVAFPVVVGVADISGTEWYFLAKIGLLVVVPGVVVVVFGRSISVIQPTQAWQWWPPLLVVAVWTVLSQVMPWNPETDFGQVDPIFLIVVATLTALTAGVGEELFYRWWLQTRLEALLGQWGGIVVASLVFALMHLGGDRQGSGVLVEIAAVIVVQGSFGLMLGYMWSKYRNLWVVILAHIIANGYGVVEHFVRG